MVKTALYSLFCMTVFSAAALAEAPYTTVVPMTEKSSYTYYVEGRIPGYGSIDFMVDTGSGYVTINDETLTVLKRKGKAKYIGELEGALADGSAITVPIYRLRSLTIGHDCHLRDVEVAVFPGDTRCILGLSALRRTAPFTFSTEPPSLSLSNCGTPI